MDPDRPATASSQRFGAMRITNLLSEDPVPASARATPPSPNPKAFWPSACDPHLQFVQAREHTHPALPYGSLTEPVTSVLSNPPSFNATTTSEAASLTAPQKRIRNGRTVASTTQSSRTDTIKTSAFGTCAPYPAEPASDSQAQTGSFIVFPSAPDSLTAESPISQTPSISTSSTATFSYPAAPSSTGAAMPPPTGNSRKRAIRTSKQPVRSSIACLSCRKSKIKCDNQGPHGACETCIKAGKKCQYSEVGAPVKTLEVAASAKTERDGERDKKRVKRYGEIFHPDQAQYSDLANEALSHEFLTAELWDQIFSYYKQHFSAELPFIHIETLRAAVHRKLATDEKLPHETNLVLLGLLTLTARFHRDLGKYVSYFGTTSSKSKSSETKTEISSASSFYALVLVSALGPIPAALTVPGVERVQALLMLGVHEWIQGSNTKAASMYIGSAIRLALNMKMNREPDSPDVPIKYCQLPKANASPKEQRAESILAEMRRRTMYSCFILDRFINLGEDAMWIMPVEKMHLRLPCVDEDLGNEMPNPLLWPSVSCLKRAEPVAFDNPLSFFVRLVDLWGEISKYSADGGRALDGPNPPWKESRFKTLSDTLGCFVECLPEAYKCTLDNYRQQEGSKVSLFISVHCLIALCQIMLHREYVPFVALRCTAPVGPLDPPLLTEAPEGFWDNSADILFRASREIADLVTWSESQLPFSPICLFGAWTSAFVGLYARHFPHMDTNHHMFSPQELDSKGYVNIAISGATGVAFCALRRMAPFMAASVVWQETFEYCDRMFHEITRRFKDQQAHERVGYTGDMSGTSLKTPGGKDLWDNGYGPRITGNSVILTTQSLETRHSTIQPGEVRSLPASPSDRDGSATPCDNTSSSSPECPGDDGEYDDVEMTGNRQIRSMLEKLTFLELGQWMQRLSPDTNDLISCVEKLHWGQAFPDQTICLDKPVEIPEASGGV